MHEAIPMTREDTVDLVLWMLAQPKDVQDLMCIGDPANQATLRKMLLQ